MKLFWNTSFYGIFWIWNLTFLMLVYIGILPYVGVPLFQATLTGDIPSEFSLTLVTLIAIPTISSIIGGWRFTKQPLQLIRLFYGIEAPLFLLCLLRLFVIRELTSASSQILITMGVCIAAFTGELFWGYADRRKSGLQWAQMLAHTLMLVFGIYAGAVLLFYALPLAVFLLQEFLKFAWLKLLWDVLYHSAFVGGLFIIIPWLAIVSFSATLFIAMPSALTAMYVHSGAKILRAFASEHGKNKTFAGAGAVIVAFAVIAVFT
ncbi:TIGR02921 family PEP-CTERM protein [Nostoc sphaeroides CHAB 2801]|uniref:TIGR02921 family PEP-CTERM protein n=1 Tax=Nostoc sphaeroides TaxID=446679 RepID=UPI001E4875B5|nr:TIGR02921 family PEP-CTERM protein [Nostoc sphaeroides]MCC5633686.1 TIGR02921 family PEP-CTERM protein [Nostoc sphaeroides CHAB 2801]